MNKNSGSSISKIRRTGLKVMKKNGYELRGYQKRGVFWMIKRELASKYRGGILADDPGLGKTIQTMALMASCPKKTLIIVPTAVLEQWKSICIQVFDRESVYVHFGPDKLRTKTKIMKLEFNICITTHGSAISRKKGTIESVLHIPDLWERVIIDEGHVIRNKKTKMNKAAMLYSSISPVNWLLTGTPVQNKVSDIISLLSFMGMSRTKIKTDLELYISSHLLRRTKKVLMDETFEDYEYNTNLVPFSTKEEQELYFNIERAALEDLADAKYSGTSEKDYNMKVLETYIRESQACSHPQIALDSIARKYGEEFNREFSGDSTKMERIVADIILAEGMSLVFCHFNTEMQRIASSLDENDVSSEFYDGSMSHRERELTLKKFRGESSGSPKVLIIQIMAGGVGLNLQNFSNVFILSPDWNPTNEIQAIARAHRFGQKKKVTVNKYLVVYNREFMEIGGDIDENCTTIDERILERQKEKRVLMARLLKDDTLSFNEKIRLNDIVNPSRESIVSDFII